MENYLPVKIFLDDFSTAARLEDVKELIHMKMSGLG